MQSECNGRVLNSRKVLVVGALDLESLGGEVRALAQKLLCQLPPHERSRLGVRDQVIAAFANHALVQFGEVEQSRANLWFRV